VSNAIQSSYKCSKGLPSYCIIIVKLKIVSANTPLVEYFISHTSTHLVEASPLLCIVLDTLLLPYILDHTQEQMLIEPPMLMLWMPRKYCIGHI